MREDRFRAPRGRQVDQGENEDCGVCEASPDLLVHAPLQHIFIDPKDKRTSVDGKEGPKPSTDDTLISSARKFRGLSGSSEFPRAPLLISDLAITVPPPLLFQNNVEHTLNLQNFHYLNKILFIRFIPAEISPFVQMERTWDKRAINERNMFTPDHHVAGRRLTAVRNTNSMCFIRTARIMARRRHLYNKPDREKASPFKRKCGSYRHLVNSSQITAGSPVFRQRACFYLDSVAAFMYIFRVLLGRSNVSCRALEHPTPP